MNLWVLPALFSVMVFTGLVLATWLIGREPSAVIQSQAPSVGRARSVSEPQTQAPLRLPFELRSPDRASAAVEKGLLRHPGH